MNLPSLARLLLTVLLASLPASPQAQPAAPSPEAIVAKHVEAIGGREALRAVRTVRIRGRNASLGAADRHVVRCLRQPNLLRQEAPGDGAFILADGEKVYSVGPAGPAEFAQPWAKTFLHTRIDGGFLEPSGQGVRYEYVGTEGITNGPWRFHHLKRTFADGYTEDLYFEVESGLLRIVVEENGRAKRVYYEYRDAGGVLFPYVWATVFDDREPPHVFVVDEVQLNPVLDDDLFRVRR